MKKLLFFALCSVLAFTACEQAEIAGPDALDGNVITLKATHEGTAAASRTELSGSSVLWSAGDRIKLVWSGANAASEALASGGSSATFEVEIPDAVTPAYAVYPSTIAAAYDGSALTVTVPAEQTGDTFGGAAIELAEYNGGDLSFKHLCGLLKVTVPDHTPAVASVRISAYGGKTIAGEATVAFSAGVPVVSSVTSPSSSVTLSVSGAGTYYAALLPADLQDGFYIELLDDSDNVIGQKLTGKQLDLKRRDVANLGEIPASLGKFVKVTASGSGDGSSWNNAMGWSDFKTLINSGYSGLAFLAGYTDETKYTGTETSIGGTSNFSIFGGYNPFSDGTDLSDRDVATYITAFDGAKANRLFVWNNNKINTSFDGVTFQNAYKNSSDVGSGIIIQSCSSAQFHNCVIQNNKKEGANGGGAIRANKGNIYFKNCTFARNKSYASGGALYVNQATVDLDNCMFSADTASIGMGSAIYIGGECVVRMNKCSFDKNVAQNSPGTVNVNSTSAKVYLNACDFYSNKTHHGGSCIDSRGKVGIMNSVFQLNQNSAATEAANIYGRDGLCALANVSMRNNAVSAVCVWSDTTAVSIVNSTFVNSNAKGTALKTTENMTSYGHNLYSKLNETVADTYIIQDPGHVDAQNSPTQTWDGSLRCLTWDGTCPGGFVKATSSRVEEAIEAFDTAAGTSFKDWLESLSFEGGNALQTDIRGVTRAGDWWPGSYQN